jgi:MFS family permease
MEPTLERPTRRAYAVWAVGLAAYTVAVFHRSSLGVAAVEAQERFSTGASAVALFLVLQLAVYAALQVPVGLALDRFGSRKLLLTGALTMAAGQLTLALAGDVPTAVAARVLVGTGDAMTFISLLRVVSFWFPGRTVPFVTQLTGILGQVGQIVAAYPLVALLHGTSWPLTTRSSAGPRPGWRSSGRDSWTPGRSRATGSASTPTWSPSSPAPSSRCCGAIRS